MVWSSSTTRHVGWLRSVLTLWPDGLNASNPFLPDPLASPPDGSPPWCRIICRFSDAMLWPLQEQGRELVGHVEHHIMPAGKLLLPPAALSCLGVKLPERTVKATRQNVSDVCDAVAGAADLRRRFKTGQRMHRALSVHPVGHRQRSAGE